MTSTSSRSLANELLFNGNFMCCLTAVFMGNWADESLSLWKKIWELEFNLKRDLCIMQISPAAASSYLNYTSLANRQKFKFQAQLKSCISAASLVYAFCMATAPLEVKLQTSTRWNSLQILIFIDVDDVFSGRLRAGEFGSLLFVRAAWDVINNSTSYIFIINFLVPSYLLVFELRQVNFQRSRQLCASGGTLHTESKRANII